MKTPILRSLLWKEWREVRWKAAALLAIAFAVYAVAALEWRHLEKRVYLSDVLATLAPALLVFLPAGGVFLGMWAAVGERERGTGIMWRELPARSEALLGTKLAAGMATSLLPAALLALLTALLYLAERNHPPLVAMPGGIPATWLVAMIGLTISSFVWTVAAGIRQPTQVRAGVAGLGAVAAGAALIVVAGFIGEMYLHHFGWSETNRDIAEMIVVIPLWFTPLGYSAIMIEPRWLSWPWLVGLTVGIQALLWIGLVAWAMLRQRAVEAPERGGDAAANIGTQFVPIPVRVSRTSAVIWFQWKRIEPVAIMCVVITIGLTVVLLAAFGREHWGDDFHEALVDVSVVVGSVVAILLGIGVFALDAQKSLERFWRSRPISPTLWFWLRYLTGAAVLMIGLHGSVLMAFSGTGGWFVTLAERGGWHTIGILIGSPLIDLFLYSAAVALVCMLRQPVYAGILAVGTGMAIWAGGGLVALAWSEHPLWLAVCRGFSLVYVADALEQSPPAAALAALGQFFVTMVSASAVTAWVGYVAIKRNIQLAGG